MSVFRLMGLFVFAPLALVGVENGGPRAGMAKVDSTSTLHAAG
jgi:hypothetical protein